MTKLRLLTFVDKSDEEIVEIYKNSEAVASAPVPEAIIYVVMSGSIPVRSYVHESAAKAFARLGNFIVRKSLLYGGIYDG